MPNFRANRILAALSEEELSDLMPELETRELALGDQVYADEASPKTRARPF